MSEVHEADARLRARDYDIDVQDARPGREACGPMA